MGNSRAPPGQPHSRLPFDKAFICLLMLCLFEQGSADAEPSSQPQARGGWLNKGPDTQEPGLERAKSLQARLCCEGCLGGCCTA